MPSRGRGRFWTILTAAAVLNMACGSNGAATGSPDAAPVAAAVTTAVSTGRRIAVRIESTGTFRADQTSNVAPESPGLVVAAPVDVGSFVRAGEPLIELDERDARLRLERAQALFQQAEANLRQARSRIGLTGESAFDAANVPEAAAARAAYESAAAQARLAAVEAGRYARLVETGDVSRSRYESMQTQAETAQAHAEAARLQYEAATNAARQGYEGTATAEAALAAVRAEAALAAKVLEDMVVRAPFDGFVVARQATAGEYVTTSAPVAVVARTNPLRLELQIPEIEAGRVRVGQTVTATVSAHAGREFLGVVSALNPAIDPASRAFTVEAVFSNPDLHLQPGMFAIAAVQLPETIEAVYVPEAAVVRDPSTASAQVFVIDEGVARVRVVQTGERHDGIVRIRTGLASGQTVATGNFSELYDGAPVETLNP